MNHVLQLRLATATGCVQPIAQNFTHLSIPVLSIPGRTDPPPRLVDLLLAQGSSGGGVIILAGDNADRGSSGGHPARLRAVSTSSGRTERERVMGGGGG